MTCASCKYDADVVHDETGVGYCLDCFSRVPGTATLIPSNPEFVSSSKYYRVPRFVSNQPGFANAIIKVLGRMAG